MCVLDVNVTKSADSDTAQLNQSSAVIAVEIESQADVNNSPFHSTGADSRRSPAVVQSSSKVVTGKAVAKRKQNTAAPVANGETKTDNNDPVYTNMYSPPVANSAVDAGLCEADISSNTVSSGENLGQEPVVSANSSVELVADVGFTCVVRRKRKDTGSKPKAQQSDELCSFWHRRPARPAHSVAQRTSVHHTAYVNQKSPIAPADVELWDSTSTAFPALPSLRVRRSSTGDVPTASESNDDASDMESVKSMQLMSTAWGTSSYASVVVGNTSNKQPASVTVTDIRSDSGLHVSPSCPHISDPSTSEIAVTDQFDTSDFMVDSSISLADDSCTDQTDIQTQSRCARPSRHTVLFFDTRSKTSSTMVPSLDISFGYDDSLASAACLSNSLVTAGDALTQAKQTADVEFLQRSSVTEPSASTSAVSTVDVLRSPFDLRTAQKYLMSGE